MEKIDFLFRFVQGDIRQRLILDEEALYSTTDQLTADKITSDILKIIPSYSNCIITDATACVGGNTYSFAQNYPYVHAIEKDTKRCSLLKHNLDALNVSNVKVSCGDAFEVCKKYTQDLIFIDPPWGGPDYKRLDKIDLYLSGRPLSDFCKHVVANTKYIAIKAPVNFDESKFVQDTCKFMEMVHKNMQLRKMYLYVFKICR